jgi:hypothetical protein
MHEDPFRKNIQARHKSFQLFNENTKIVEERVKILDGNFSDTIYKLKGHSSGSFVDNIKVALTLEDLDHLGKHFRLLRKL